MRKKDAKRHKKKEKRGEIVVGRMICEFLCVLKIRVFKSLLIIIKMLKYIIKDI